MDPFDQFLGYVVNGVTLGAIYALIAVGYTMVYGIIKLINFAHGEVFMLGTFFGLMFVNKLGLTLGIALAASMAGCLVVGILLDWTAYLPLRRSKLSSDVLSTAGIIAMGAVTFGVFLMRQDHALDTGFGRFLTALLIAVPAMLFAAALLETFGAFGPPRRTFESDRMSALITAIGMSLTLQTLAMLIWTPYPYSFSEAALPAFMNQRVMGLVLGKEICVWAAAVVLLVVLNLMVARTRIGKAMRACSQDKNTAALMGINVNRIILLTFGIGSAMAAVAGILYAVKVGGNISFRMGYYPGVIAFAAAVLGGIGSLKGAALGGLILGLTQSVCSGYISSEYDFAFAFGAVILVILVRPWGLLGRPGAARA